jgi:hypothetical protein
MDPSTGLKTFAKKRGNAPHDSLITLHPVIACPNAEAHATIMEFSVLNLEKRLIIIATQALIQSVTLLSLSHSIYMVLPRNRKQSPNCRAIEELTRWGTVWGFA